MYTLTYTLGFRDQILKRPSDIFIIFILFVQRARICMTVTTLCARRIQRPDFKSPSDIVALFVQPPRISRIYRLLDPLGFTSSEGGVRILNGTSQGKKKQQSCIRKTHFIGNHDLCE